MIDAQYSTPKSEQMFKGSLVAVSCYVIAYSIIYWLLGARLSSIVLLGGGVVFTPILLWLVLKKAHNQARLTFNFASLYYIQCSTIGIRSPLHEEYYYLAALVLPLLLFEKQDRRWAYFCMMLCPLSWLIGQGLPSPQLSNYWIPDEFPARIFQIMNFFGASIIIGIFLKLFSDENTKLYQTLKESNQQLQQAQQIAKIGNWSFDLESSKISWSKQMFEMFPENISSGEPSFEKHYQTIHPDDRLLWKETVDKCLLDGKSYKIIFRVQFPDKIVWVEAHGQGRLDLNNKVIGLFGTCQDVTELHLLNKKLDAQRIVSIQQAKLASLGEMSAGIAHEINNPLAIISGHIEFLPKHLGNPSLAIEKIEKIRKSCERISKIVLGLKKFSRSDLKGRYAERSLKNIAQEVLLLTEAHSKRHDTAVKLNCESQANINCNEVEIEQVLINLVNNAIEAVMNQSTKWVEISIIEDDDWVIARVSDSGTGIPNSIKAKIFEPFYTTKPVGSGTGLGLSISKGILDEHNATFKILEDSPNTCFEVRFPKLKPIKEAA